MRAKINKLIAKSREVLLDNCLSNGVIIAGNSANPSYSNHTPNYMYSWPRDASFIAVALDVLGLGSYTEKYFEWCLTRAGNKSGLLWQHYTPNGLPDGFFISELYNKKIFKKLKKFIHPHAYYPHTKSLRSQLQPDGNGLLLWALSHHIKYNKSAQKKFLPLAHNLANGLVSIWDKDSFAYLINDPWEEKLGYPGINLTYTVATSIAGLEIAIDLYGQKPSWNKTKNEMRKSIKKTLEAEEVSAIYGAKYNKLKYQSLYTKLFSPGGFNPEVDASLMALVWPTNIINGQDSASKIVKLLSQLDRKGGVIRYPGDSYDGIFIDGSSFRTGGKSWPMLNLWATICLAKLGNKKLATKYYDWVLKRVANDIPEQINEKNKHAGPYQLPWAHAMFVLASKELGYY